jgi:hypothetical protein
MKLGAPVLVLCLGLAGCGDGVPFNGPDEEPGGDTSSGMSSVYFSPENSQLTANNITYDAATDTLTINNIPFDDPENKYQKITTEAFSNNFDAYESAPAVGSNEFQYYAVFQRTGQSQVAAVGTDEYVGFGFGGAGAQRLGAKPTLPTTGIYSYTGEYAAVRTTRNHATIPDGIQYVTGVVQMSADFGDFDGIGAVTGIVNNRRVYNTAGVDTGPLDGYISLANNGSGQIDSANAVITSATATEYDSANVATATGSWEGVFAGPGGKEIAGIVFVEGINVRETGGIIANCVTPAPTCP